MLRVLVLCLCTVPVVAADPPAFKVSRTVPMTATTEGPLIVKPGRFVPLELSSGKAALVECTAPGTVTVFQVPAGNKIIGIRFDEPDGAEEREYGFPEAKGRVYVVIIKKALVTATVRALVNGATDADPPTVAGEVSLASTKLPDPIVPVPPVDTLLKALQTAFDGESPADKAKLAGLIQSMRFAAGKAADTGMRTNGDLTKAVSDETARLVGTSLMATRRAIGDYLATQFSRDVFTLTSTDRGNFTATYTKLADTLTGVR
jgi:hypothetical protein